MKKISARSIRAALPKIAITILAFAGVGYISSVITQQRCENATAQSLVNGPMAGKLFYVIIGDETSQEIFSRVGAKFTPYTVVRHPNLQPGKGRISRLTWPDGKKMPHVDKGGRVATVGCARVMLPFLVSVEYSSVEASLSGGGGAHYYFCLFGLPLKIIDEVGWVS